MKKSIFILLVLAGLVVLGLNFYFDSVKYGQPDSVVRESVDFNREKLNDGSAVESSDVKNNSSQEHLPVDVITFDHNLLESFSIIRKIDFENEPLGVYSFDQVKNSWNKTTGANGVEEGRCKIIIDEETNKKSLQVSHAKNKTLNSIFYC